MTNRLVINTDHKIFIFKFQFDRDKMSVAEYSVLVKKMPKIINRKKMIEVHMRLAEMIQSHVYCKQSDSIKLERGSKF